MTMDRAEIAGSITADLEKIGQEETPPVAEEKAAPVAVEAEKTQESATVPDAPAETPAAEVKPVVLKDTDLVIDPADGKAKTWGEVKGERLRQADYTRKTMTLAEERRAVEAEKARLQAEYNAAVAAIQAAAAAQTAQDDLPEDDPYAKRIKAIEAKAIALEKQRELDSAMMAERTRMEEQMQIAAARDRLEAAEAKAAEQYKLEDREKNIVGHELLQRLSAGDSTASYDSVAKEYYEWREAQRAAIKEAAVREYKEKHRVGSPAAAKAAPSPGVATEQVRPGSRGFTDAIREELAAMMR